MTPMIRLISMRLLAAAALTASILVFQSRPTEADPGNPFDVMLGTWRGSGQIQLSQGKTERLKCNAYYTGGGSTLGMAIRCQSESSSVEIRSKLSQSGGRITGTWEERTFNAQGNASGQAANGRMTLAISGAVTGSMLVSYSASRQSVSISTQNIALKSVSIDLTRS
jgi:hypothetical protein